MNDAAPPRQQNNLAHPIAAIAFASLIFLIPAMLNGFPFVFPDSGDYLVFTPRIYRSPYYGLLIFFFHLNRWIWAPVVAQAFLISHLLWMLLRLNGIRHANIALAIMACFLTMLSSLPYFVGFIMADLFTPIMFLTMYILAFHFSDLSRPSKLYFLVLGCVATAAHVSNLTIACLLLVFLVLLLAWCGRARATIYRRIGILCIPLGLAAAAILLFNIVIFGSFSLVPAGSSFLMANLIQYGPARTYLDSACPKTPYKICAFLPRISPVVGDPETADKLLWSSGIFQELGGFTGMKDESRTIVSATIRKYPLEVLQVVAQNFAAGLFRHQPAAEFRSEYQVPSMALLFKQKFGDKAQAAYLASAEMRDTVPHELISKIDSITLPFMFFTLIALGLCAGLRGDRRHAAFAAFVIFAVLENTLLCTSLSGVHDRYQARVSWLIPLAVFVLLAAGATRSRVNPATAGAD